MGFVGDRRHGRQPHGLPEEDLGLSPRSGIQGVESWLRV